MDYGTTDSVLKPLSEVALPDPRFQVLAIRSENVWRPFDLADLHSRLSKSQLDANVPERVRTQFETAKNVMLYTWFVYEFQTVAEMQSFASLEFALQTRFPDSKKEVRRKGQTYFIPAGLRTLLARAVSEGLINGERLPTWDRIQARRRWQQENHDVQLGKALSVSEWEAALLEFIPNMRNDLAHGGSKLHLGGSFQVLELCADLINALFVSPIVNGETPPPS